MKRKKQSCWKYPVEGQIASQKNLMCVSAPDTFLGAGIQQCRAILDSLDADVKLDLDTANIYIAGAGISELMNANKNRIGIVHLTDSAFKDIDNIWQSALPEFPKGCATKVFTDPGEGKIDLKSVTDTLKEIGYDGAVVINPGNSYDISRSVLRARYYLDRHILNAGSAKGCVYDCGFKSVPDRNDLTGAISREAVYGK